MRVDLDRDRKLTLGYKAGMDVEAFPTTPLTATNPPEARPHHSLDRNHPSGSLHAHFNQAHDGEKQVEEVPPIQDIPWVGILKGSN